MILLTVSGCLRSSVCQIEGGGQASSFTKETRIPSAKVACFIGRFLQITVTESIEFCKPIQAATAGKQPHRAKSTEVNVNP